MSLFTNKDEAPTLQGQIDEVLLEMGSHKTYTEEYDKLLNQLERLYKLQAPEKARRISPDAIVAVVGNLAGIVMILNFERVHVVTSKALGFVLKTKL